MRENYFIKAKRLLVNGRVRVLRVDGDEVDAEVRRDSARIYRVAYRPGEWTCNCPALGRCSHLQAVMLVVTTAAVTTAAVRHDHEDLFGAEQDGAPGKAASVRT